MNVVFVSMDTLRADRLGCLGGTRGLTPNLDRIAGEAALFTQTFSSDIPTQPSHTALFTGRFGTGTDVVSHFHPGTRLDEATPWLPSIFQGSGYHTGAVDHLFSMKDWFVRGYDDYMPPAGRSRSPGSVINEIGFPWITEHTDEDFFLFLHYWDAHIPYLPPPPFIDRFTADSVGRIDPLIMEQLRSRPTYPLFKCNLYDHLDWIPNLQYVKDLYDAEVAYLDYEIGRLFVHLKETGVLDDTIVVLFSDHGEVMTEHDAWFDHTGLYDSVTHVPLIIWSPKVVAPQRVDAMVQLVDVMPTVLELLGRPQVDGLDGRSLVPVLRGERTTHRDAVMLSECTWQAKRAVRTSEWKYIRCYDPGVYAAAPCELYHLSEDPGEQVNVAREFPQIVAQLSDRLDGWLARQLANRPDPMATVIADGLPAVKRLAGIIDGMSSEPASGESTSDRQRVVVPAAV